MNSIIKNSKYKNLKIDICDYSHIENYLRKICANIYDLLELYCVFYKIENTEEYIINCLHNDNIHSAGQVRPCDILYIPYYGNIREMMTFIYMFGLNSSKVIISLMLDDNFYNYVKHIANINDNILNDRYDNFKICLGLNCKTKIIKFMNNNKFTQDNKGDEFITSSGNSLPCLFASLVKYGICNISKNSDFPFIEKARISNKNIDYNTFHYETDDIYPKLSKRELDWFIEKNITEYIPWKSGGQYYIMNDKSFFKTAADIYNQKTLSGFSGTSDLVLDVMSLFNEFDTYTSLHSCLIWMCCGKIKDHSIYEILVALMPYGIDYTIDIDAEEYCIKKNLILKNYY